MVVYLSVWLGTLLEHTEPQMVEAEAEPELKDSLH
jgi:hypothetical protein